MCMYVYIYISLFTYKHVYIYVYIHIFIQHNYAEEGHAYDSVGALFESLRMHAKAITYFEHTLLCANHSGVERLALKAYGHLGLSHLMLSREAETGGSVYMYMHMYIYISEYLNICMYLHRYIYI